MQKEKIGKGIYRLEDGRIRVRTTATCPIEQKVKWTTRTLDPGQTVDDARTMIRELKEAIRNPPSPNSDPGLQITTVADYAERWMARGRRKKWKHGTAEKHEDNLADRILPMVGHIPIARFTRLDLTRWIDWAEEQRVTKGKHKGKPYADRTVKGWYATLRGMLRDAEAEGFMERDVTRRQDPPQTGIHGRQEKRTLNGEQREQLVAMTRKFQRRRWAEVAMLAYSGMRPCEVYALEWEDVHYWDGSIFVSKAVYDKVPDVTKTGRTRHVPSPDILFEALQEHRRKQLDGDAPKGRTKDLVFPSTKGGYRMGQSIQKPLNLVTKHLGIEQRVTPQVLRRTYNTLLVLEAAIDRILLRALTDHESEEMTELYAGVGLDVLQAAVKKGLGRYQACTWDRSWDEFVELGIKPPAPVVELDAITG